VQAELKSTVFAKKFVNFTHVHCGSPLLLGEAWLGISCGHDLPTTGVSAFGCYY